MIKDKHLANPSTYNIYDRGYRSASQTSLFIGPIWVEEILQIQLSTGTSDVPVYPYSSPYYDRLLLGNYIIEGTFGITYTEPDYLLRIIELAASESIQDEELYNIIENRKNIFLQTVKSKLIDDLMDRFSGEGNSQITEYATSYVERITREIETSSLSSGNKLNPREFEITLITGNIYDNTQSIEIYENIKITGTSKVITNDDNSLVELYTFTGRKKPDKTKTVQVKKERHGVFSKPNLLKVASEIAEQLVDNILKPPVINILSNENRTSYMYNTDRLAPAGLINSGSRFQGKTAQFVEIVYSFEHNSIFSNKINSMNLESEGDKIQSYGEVELYDDTTFEKLPTSKLYLDAPESDSTAQSTENSNQSIKGFDNRLGRLVHIDREGTSKYVTAISTVVPVVTETQIGGSIIMPRYKPTSYDIGSFIPPNIIDDKEIFDYNDSDTHGLTISTLWCCLLGFRNSQPYLGKPQPGEEKSKEAIEKSDKYITEVSQPVFTFAYIERVRTNYIETNFERDSSVISISEPSYIDYKELNKSEVTNNKKTLSIPEPLNEGEYTHDITFEFTKLSGNSPELIRKLPKDEALGSPTEEESSDAIINIIQEEIELEKEYTGDEQTIPNWQTDTLYIINTEVLVGPKVYKCIIEHTSGTTFEEDKDKWEDQGLVYDPHFFTIDSDIIGTSLSTDFNKCLYLIPYIFVIEGTCSNIIKEFVPEVGEEVWVCDFQEEPVPSNKIDAFCYLLSGKDSSSTRLSGYDDSCSFSMTYDWVVENNTGYTSAGNKITINGVIFIRPRKEEFYDAVIIADDGTVVKREEIYRRGFGSTKIPDRKINLFWLLSIMPVKREKSKIDRANVPIKVIHDLGSPSGRKVEIYNITRCDTSQISSLKWYNYNPEGSLLQSIKNKLTKAFEGLLNMFNIDISYNWPIQKNLERIAAYIRGYAINVNIKEMIESIKQCTFNNNNIIENIVGKNTEDGGRKWTLETAFGNASSDENRNSLIKSIDTEIGNIIRKIIKDKTALEGMRVVKEDLVTGVMQIYRFNLTPDPETVKYGIKTDDGFNELKNISYDIPTPSVSMIMGGYNE